MNTFRINVTDIKKNIPSLQAGDKVLLSGEIYTARDAAHLKLISALNASEKLPFPLDGAIIYYTGPTKTPEGMACGSAGPTTACRMDKFTPVLLENGLVCTIGKGNRSREVRESIVKNGTIYLSAIGGAGALYAKHITKQEEIAFPELGCESVKRLTVSDFPVIVAIDSLGRNIFELGKYEYGISH